MAGWMKMEKCTPDKPEILAIADALGIEPDHAFAKCFRFWAWVDEHVTGGNAVGVSPKRIDAISHCEGLAKALENVGWIRISERGIKIVNFEKHFGEGAKQRALTSNRVAEHRKRKRNAAVTPYASPEKNRIEESISTSVTNSKSLSNPSNVRHGRTTYPSSFEKFYQAYPNRVGKKAAYLAWKRAGSGIKASDQCTSEQAVAKLQAACEEFAASPKGRGGFCPHPATWLNQGRWEDDRSAWLDSNGHAKKQIDLPPLTDEDFL